jgi:hypothetical protein
MSKVKNLKEVVYNPKNLAKMQILRMINNY